MQSSALAIIENMSDIIGYAHPKVMPDGSTSRVLTVRSLDNSIRCGCRFRHITPEIEFSYKALTKALNDAIDKEAAENNGEFVTTERTPVIEAPEYNFDALLTEFGEIVGNLMNTNPNNGPKITVIVERYLGKGKKVAEATPDQAEFLHLIVSDIKDELLA